MDLNAQAKSDLRRRLRRDREIGFVPRSWLHVSLAHEIQGALVIASYLSYEFEPQTIDINSELTRMGKTLLIPRTLPDRDIEWVPWDGLPSSLRRNGKTLEPVGDKFSDESLIDAVIVPALYIDSEGNRMGQGGGSYDRALSRISAWKLGLVNSVEFGNELLPVESHDQKINAVATPTLLVRFTPGAVNHL